MRFVWTVDTELDRVSVCVCTRIDHLKVRDSTCCFDMFVKISYSRIRRPFSNRLLFSNEDTVRASTRHKFTLPRLRLD